MIVSKAAVHDAIDYSTAEKTNIDMNKHEIKVGDHVGLKADKRTGKLSNRWSSGWLVSRSAGKNTVVVRDAKNVRSSKIVNVARVRKMPLVKNQTKTEGSKPESPVESEIVLEVGPAEETRSSGRTRVQPDRLTYDKLGG